LNQPPMGSESYYGGHPYGWGFKDNSAYKGISDTSRFDGAFDENR
jgi:hypothetical protein